ncbi:MAG: cytochrome c biogenesis protein CcdA [Euryarchaeota archaeon]|nr:cytochrome c biogenesis protein CcdA [Euryarchaeota archaeon]
MNQKRIIRTVLLLLIISSIPMPAYASDDANDIDAVVEFFYEMGCKKCEKMRPIVEDVASKHNLSVVGYEITDRSGFERMDKYGIRVVPAVVISGQVTLYSDYDGNHTLLVDLLDLDIRNIPAMRNQTPTGNQTDQTNQTSQTGQTNQPGQINHTEAHQPLIRLSVPTVFVAGLIAGFNPCLLAILAFIASITLSGGESGRSGSRRMFRLVAVFCTGIFITYLVAGFGLLQAIGHTEGTRETIENILITIIILLGTWHIYDAYHVKKYDRSSFKTSGSTMRFIEDLVKKESMIAIFVLGVLFSLVKAPCVGALYLSILNMLIRDGGAYSMLYLSVYNIGVVFPVLVLGLAMTLGMQPESVNRYKDEHRSSIRFVTGVTLLAIAVLMKAGVV